VKSDTRQENETTGSNEGEALHYTYVVKCRYLLVQDPAAQTLKYLVAFTFDVWFCRNNKMLRQRCYALALHCYKCFMILP